MWIVTGVFAACFGWRLARDPRTFRAGLYLTGALGSLILGLLAGRMRELERFASIEAGQLIVALAVAAVGTVVVLGFALVGNGLVTVRREGFGLAHLLSLLLGLALLGLLAAWIWAIATEARTAATVLFAIMFPAGYFGVGFASYLLYGRIYRIIAPTMSPRPKAVIVLGAGLAGGHRVTPLLAARLDRALAVAGPGHIPIVVSGGKGTDESVSEAAAMAEYLEERGVGAEQILVEDASRTTAQNLEYSKAVLHEAGLAGPVAVVSSNYHVFRTAMLMRAAGLPGYATGGKVAAYYWPSAAIREFAAICAEHLPATLIGLAMACTPVFVLIAFALARPA
ncbi:MAG: YdcF family protein [Bifidobacteriaceae bacterium]|nr:YdcF family protein [Bifidobacteriaceae bacterium]